MVGLSHVSDARARLRSVSLYLRFLITASTDFHRSFPRSATLRSGWLSSPLAAMVLLACMAGPSFATPIPVPNFSFETPDIVFAQSFDFNPPATSPGPWGFTQSSPQQIGAFDNTAFGSDDYVDNAIGAQMAFMFVGPQITLFQDLTGPDGVFQAGQTYAFTIGAGGSSSLPDDAQLQLRLFYRDNLANKVTVAITSFLFDPNLDPGYINHLYDYSVVSLSVQASDPWAGKNIGIEIATPGTPAFAYWDLDNARLQVVPEPSPLFFIGAGLGGLALKRHRRRQSA